MNFEPILYGPLFIRDAQDINLVAASADPVDLTVSVGGSSWTIPVTPVLTNNRYLAALRMREILSSVVGIPGLANAGELEVPMVTLSAGDATMSVRAVYGAASGKTPTQLAGHWLSWRDQVSMTHAWGRERLTFLAGLDLLGWQSGTYSVKAKIFLSSGDPVTVTLASGTLQSGCRYVTVDASYATIAAAVSSSVRSKIRAWDVSYSFSGTDSQSAAATINGYPLRLIIARDEVRVKEFVFCNSFGVEDRVYSSGRSNPKLDGTSVAFLSGASEYELRNDATEGKEVYSGRLGSARESALWLDFLKAHDRYILASGSLARIVVDSQETDLQDNALGSVKFTYHLGALDGGRYFNDQEGLGDYDPAQRHGALYIGDEPPSEELPSEDLFFLKTRLDEFPAADLAEELLFLVQDPLTLEWGNASLSGIKEYLQRVITREDVHVWSGPWEDYAPGVAGYALAASLGRDLYDRISSISGSAHSHANLSVLDTITQTEVNHWDAAYSWGNHANAGYITDRGYIGTTHVQASAGTQNLTGIGSITASGPIKTTNSVQAARFYLSDSVYFVLDSNGVKLEGAGLYTDSFLSAGGYSPGGGSSGIDLAAMWASLTGSSDAYGTTKINASHIPDVASVYGYATQNWVATQGYLPATTASSTYATIAALQSDEAILDAALQSLQSQVDSVSARNDFDELTATAMFADMLSASSLYVTSVELNGADLATTLSGLAGRATALETRATTLEGYFTSGSANKALKLTNARTLWGQNFDGTANVSGNMTDVGSIAASGLIKTTNYVQAVRFYLSDSVYFVLDSNGVKLEGAGLYTDSFLSAGGYSPGGGSSGIDLAAMWASLTGTTDPYGSTLIAAAHIPDVASAYGYLKAADLTGYATQSWVASQGYATQSWVTSQGYVTSSGVTSVAMTVPTGFSVSGTPITTTGTLALAFASGYSLPTTAKQSNWDTAYGWGNHASAGYLLATTAASTYATIAALQSDEAILDAALQSLQSQVDSVSARNDFDELTATAMFADMLSASTLYVTSVELNGTDLATTLSGLAGRATALETRATTLEGYFTSGSANKALKLTNARTLWGQNFDGTANVSGNMTDVGSITASGLIKTTNYVQAARFYLSDSVYFVLDSNGVKLEGAGLYTDSFLSAGGYSPGGGSSGIDLAAMWASLTGSSDPYGSTLIAAAHIPDVASAYGYLKAADLTGYATQSWVASQGYATRSWVTSQGYVTSSGVTSVAMTVPTGFSVSGTPITTTGTLALAFASGYSLPTTAKQSNWDTAYGWGNHASAGYLLATTAASTYATIAALQADETILDAALQSLQSQIDSVSARDDFDELTATAMFADMLSASSLYVTSVELNGTDLATTLSGYALKTTMVTGTGYLTGGGDLSANRTIDIASTYKTRIDNGNTAYGWGNHASAGYLTVSEAANTYVTLSTAQTISGSKTFSATLYGADSEWSDGRSTLRLIAANGYTYIQSSTAAHDASADMYLTGLYGGVGSYLYLRFSNVYAYSNIIADGAITAGAASDARLKDDIRNLDTTFARSVIMASRPVSFVWDKKATELSGGDLKGQDYGLIAQEVEGLLPQAIGSIWGDYKRLDYTKYIAPLIAVEQDHENRILLLENELRRLNAENMRLRTELQTML